MHKSLIDLKRASDLIDEKNKIESEAEPLDSPEPIAEGEPIAEIKQGRQRKDSLEQQMADLNAQEKELNLRYKILKKKEQLEKIQLRFEQITEEESFYTEKTDTKGYTQLRDDKWQNDFQELIIKLKNIELDEFEGKVDLQTSQEAKANVTKQIKKLISIKKRTTTKNRLNKLKRGFKSTMKGIGNLSNEIGKVTDDLGKMGGQFGEGKRSKNNTDWDNFFSDTPKKSKSTNTTKKRKSRKKGKKSKTRKKAKKTKSTKTTKKRSGDFGGFSF